jgi:putative ATP-dependent endonuclease of OLD family
MKIRRVRIQNFRCLEDVDIAFDDVTTFVGPNGAGKSSVLRALDWFFNGGKSSKLTVEDIYLEDEARAISVEVEFDNLSDADREQLGKYAPAGGEAVTIWRRWENGTEKITGRGRVLPEFEEIRKHSAAADRRAAYQALRGEQTDLGLPAWSNVAAADEAMATWEAANTSKLVDAEIESGTHFFGFAGQAKMSGLFDFIFVSADLRASEESQDTRAALIGRILEQAVDRTGADTELSELVQKMSAAQGEIHDRHFASQLESLSEQLTAAVSTLATGRTIKVSSQSVPLQPQRAEFRVHVQDETVETRVERQGHGFQRALLISALKLLAEHGRGDGETGVLCLAIEEPELYQHPLQARSFAAVLRSLAEDDGQGVQIAYATHSPYFIEARSFHQIRRVTRKPQQDAQGTVQILASSVQRVTDRLAGVVDPPKIRRQLDSVCLGGLGEAFFADIVLLVEGSTDRAVLTGVAARDAVPLMLDGIFVGEAGGKQGLLLPYVIFDELGIPAYVVADNDSHLPELVAEAKAAGDLDLVRKRTESVADSIRWNKLILGFFDLEETDYPVGPVSPRLTFVDGGLEDGLTLMWPAWAELRQELIDDGVGFSGKDHATYQEAALRAPGEVPEPLRRLFASAKALRFAA